MKKVIIVIALAFTLFSAVSCKKSGPENTVLTPEDAEGKTIGYLLGTSSYVYASETGIALAYNSTVALMEDLKSGVLDCVLMEKGLGTTLAKQTRGVKVLSVPLLEYDLSFAIAKENLDLTRAVNVALNVLSDNGTLKGLVNKHLRGKKYTYIVPSTAGTRPGSLHFMVPEDFPPYSYFNSDGELTGFDVEIARAVCDYLGVGMTIESAPMDKLVVMVQYGKADFAAGGLYANEADSELVDFSDTYVTMTQVLLVRS